MGNAQSSLGAKAAELVERAFAAFPKPDVHPVVPAAADEDNVVVFSRTVGPQQQAAIVAWAELAAAAAGTAATAPALPVMVAAMLRRPALDAFLERAAEALSAPSTSDATTHGGDGVFFPLFTDLPDGIRGSFRAREELVPGNGLGCAGARAEEVLRHGLTDANSIFRPGAPHYSAFATPCAALAVLAAHGDLADALLLVPQLTSQSPEGLVEARAAAGGDGEKRLCVSASPSRCVSTSLGIVPSAVKTTIAGRADGAAFAAVLLLANRDPVNARIAYASVVWPQRAFRGTLTALGRDALRDPTVAGPTIAALDAMAQQCSKRGAASSGDAMWGQDGAGLVELAKLFAQTPRLQANGIVQATTGAGDARAVLATLTTASTPAEYLSALGKLLLSVPASVPPAAAAAAAAADDDDDSAVFAASVLHPPTPFAALLRQLIGVDAADLAVAARATTTPSTYNGGGHCTSLLSPLISALFRFERSRQLGRHGTDHGGKGEYVSFTRAMLPTRELLIPAWRAGGGGDDAVVVRSAGNTAEAVFPVRAHVVFEALWRPVAVGAPATNGRAAFLAAWAELTGGVLDAWPHWAHTMAVGGAVAWCLDPRRPDDDDDDRPSDVDLLFHSVTPEGEAVLRSRLVEHCCAFAELRAGGGHPAVLATSRTMTVIFDAPELPRIQVGFGRWESQVDCLQTADVDCCCAGFDGTAALLTARGALAWSLRANVPNRARHEVRGSPTYEMRLWKYARRHGFAVLDVAQTADCPALRFHRAVLEKKAAAERAMREMTYRRAGLDPAAQEVQRHRRRHRTESQRAIATSAEGIMWLLHVDEGTLVPTEPKDTLKVTSATPLRKILSRVSRAGYVESDNYGSHEEGYLVLDDDGPPAEEAGAFDPARHDLRSPGGAAAALSRTEWLSGWDGGAMAALKRSTLPANVHAMLDVDRVKMAADAAHVHRDTMRDVWRVPPIPSS